MKNKIKLSAIFCSYIFTLCYCNGQLQNINAQLKLEEDLLVSDKFATHAMLVFLDDSEDKLDAVSEEVLMALHDQAAPILVTRHVLNNIYTQPTLQELLQKEKQKYQPINDYFELLKQTLAQLIHNKPNEVEKEKITQELNNTLQQKIPQMPEIDQASNTAILLTEISIDFNQWIIKEASKDTLLLLIPRNYKPSNKDVPPLLNYVPSKLNSGKLSQSELALGLKIDHMPTIDSKDFIDQIKQPKPKQADRNYFIQAVWDEQTQQSSIFITRKEYTQAKTPVTQMPHWVFWLDGHGAINTKIAGLTIEQNNFLHNFLDTKIITKLLVYLSCYAAGTNMERLYKDFSSSKEKQSFYSVRSFTIVFQGIVEVVTYGGEIYFNAAYLNSSDLDFVDKKLQIHFEKINFSEFVDNVTTVDVITSYAKALAPVMGGLTEGKRAMIKLAGLDLFNILALDDTTFAITPIMVKTRTAPLKISSIKKTVKNILLYTPMIPFDIECDTDTAFTFYSMLPGTAVHKFYKISALNVGYSEFIESFIAIESKAKKVYMIDEINLGTPLILPSGKSTTQMNQVIIDVDEIQYQNENQYYRSFFSLDNQFYEVVEDRSDLEKIDYKVVAAIDYTKKYENEINIIVKKQLEKLEQQKATLSNIEQIQEKKALEIAKKKNTERKAKIKQQRKPATKKPAQFKTLDKS